MTYGGNERAEPGYVPGLHLRVLLEERRLLVQQGGIILLDVPASVGRADTLWYRGREWTFATPPGRRVVRAKEADPVWTPPDWHYAERAKQNNWELVQLQRGGTIALADGSRLTVRGQRVVRVLPGGRSEPVPLDEDIVLGDVLVVPPFGTANRRLRGELGRFKLDLGDGYLIHGTPREETIGGATTHGCVHLADEHLEMLFQHIPLGTSVFIY
ncbi:MAG: L,D-transpeptidase [Gemmatimonadetes bacterium]|nr:L,D-transpeptidase [Gemmatimonadota bacterium]